MILKNANSLLKSADIYEFMENENDFMRFFKNMEYFVAIMDEHDGITKMV